MINQKENKKMASVTSMDEKLSDLVGSVSFKPNKKSNIKLNFALDQNYQDINYNEVETNFNFDYISFDFNYLSEISSYQVIGSFLFLFINLIFASLRIKEIVGKKNLFFFIRVNWISTFVSIFLPNLAGTELTRGYILKKELKEPLSKIITYIFVDRVFGFMTLCFFTIYLLYFYEKNFFYSLLFISIIVFILIVIYEEKIIKFFKKRFNFSHRIIIYAFLSNLAMIFHIYSLMDFNIIKPHTLELISIIALFIILNTVSITPLGFGLTELIFLNIFNNLVINKEEYMNSWEVPAIDSWHSRYFKIKK